eukprot:48990_1
MLSLLITVATICIPAVVRSMPRRLLRDGGGHYQPDPPHVFPLVFMLQYREGVRPELSRPQLAVVEVSTRTEREFTSLPGVVYALYESKWELYHPHRKDESDRQHYVRAQFYAEQVGVKGARGVYVIMNYLPWTGSGASEQGEILIKRIDKDVGYDIQFTTENKEECGVRCEWYLIPGVQSGLIPLNYWHFAPVTCLNCP